MGKGKMSMLDVRCIVKELRSKLIGLRLANIYHLNKTTYLFKLAASSIKEHLLIESGVRVHTTSYSREHDPAPNPFAVKLRKHIRLLRLDDINQLGVDRVIDFTFTSGERCYHVLIELYAQGNIVLTDKEYLIIMVLRVHTYVQKTLTEAEREQEQRKQIQQRKEIEGEEKKEEEEIVETEEKDDRLSVTSVDRVAVREYYPFKYAQQEQKEVTRSMIELLIEKQKQKQREEEEKIRIEEEKEQSELEKQTQLPLDESETIDDETNNQARKGKKKKKAVGPPLIAKVSKSRRKVKIPPLKAVLASVLHFGPELIEHCLLITGINPNEAMDVTFINEEMIEKLVEAFREAPRMLKKIGEESMEGFIVVREEGGKDIQLKKPKLKKKIKGTEIKEIEGETTLPSPPTNVDRNEANEGIVEPSLESLVKTLELSVKGKELGSSAVSPAKRADRILVEKADDVVEIYSEYLCTLLSQHSTHSTLDYSQNCRLVSFPSLDAAMDEFYSKQEEQREKIRLIKEKAAALAKVDRVRQSHQHQLTALEKAQMENEKKAQLIQANYALVDEVIAAVNMELAKGIDWRDLQRLLKAEKEKGNIVALVISQLKLEENTVTLSLSPDLIHLRPQSSIEEKKQAMKFDVNLSLSAFNNAELYYSQKKKNAAKAVKTEDASSAAIKAAEKKTALALKEVDVRAKINKIRKLYWFEKYHWFITSENYLVIGGKDAQQNEALVKKHLDKNDLYFHAEVHGASSVILKNPHSDVPVPPLSISQAAVMTICRSAAWKSKISVEAYWVYADQVSKTAPTGMFLTTGSFMVRGKRNFVPRQPLVMGLGVLFRLDEGSIARHKGERRIRGVEEDEKKESAEERRNREKEESNDTDSVASEDVEGDEHLDDDDDDDEADYDVTSQLVFAAHSKGFVREKSIMEELEELEEEEEKEENGSKQEKEKALEFGLVAQVKEPPVSSRITLAETVLNDRASARASVDAETAAEASVKAEEEKRAATAKKRQTAAERRKVRKQQKSAVPNEKNSDILSKEQKFYDDSNELDAAQEEGEEEVQSKKSKSKGKNRAVNPSSSVEKSKAPAPPSLSRSQRNKAKKIAKKYGLQDEEDLEIAASVLGLQNIDKKRKEIQEREKIITGKRQEKEDMQQNEEEEPAAETELSPEESKRTKNKKEIHQKIKNGVDKKNFNGMERKKVEEKPESKLIAIAATGAASSNDKSDKGNNEVSDAEKVCFNCKQRGHVFKLCPYRKQLQKEEEENQQEDKKKWEIENVSMEKEMRSSDDVIPSSFSSSASTFSSARRAAKEFEQKELKEIMAEENLEDVVDSSGLDEINVLTGRPVAEDLLSFAIPVCAPYSALNDYKYKVKLLSGTQKKGKVISQAISLFRKISMAASTNLTPLFSQINATNNTSTTPTTLFGSRQEDDLLKGMNENEIMGVLVSGVKLSAPGLNDGSKRRKKREEKEIIYSPSLVNKLKLIGKQ